MFLAPRGGNNGCWLIENDTSHIMNEENRAVIFSICTLVSRREAVYDVTCIYIIFINL